MYLSWWYSKSRSRVFGTFWGRFEVRVEELVMYDENLLHSTVLNAACERTQDGAKKFKRPVSDHDNG